MNGKKLKEKIDKLGLSQRKLSELMEVTPQTISAFLTAKDIRTSTIERIALVTNMPVSFFFNDEQEKQGSLVSGTSSVAVTGNNNVAGNVTVGDSSVLSERVVMLERLLEEKERLIKVLLDKKKN